MHISLKSYNFQSAPLYCVVGNFRKRQLSSQSLHLYWTYHSMFNRVQYKIRQQCVCKHIYNPNWFRKIELQRLNEYVRQMSIAKNGRCQITLRLILPNNGQHQGCLEQLTSKLPLCTLRDVECTNIVMAQPVLLHT